MSKAVTNLHLSAGVDDSDSVRVIGNSGDICSETAFCAQNPCSVGYGGTSSPAAPRETKDNKNQSDFFINPSFLPSAPEENFSEDGIEGQAAVKELSFLEILAAMGLDLEDWYFFYSRDPTSEKDLLYVDEVNRRTKTLHIPENLRRDKMESNKLKSFSFSSVKFLVINAFRSSIVSTSGAFTSLANSSSNSGKTFVLTSCTLILNTTGAPANSAA